MNPDPGTPIFLSRDDILRLATWQGMMGEALENLKKAVERLSATGATKIDVEAASRRVDEVKEKLEASLFDLQRAIESKIDALGTVALGNRLTTVEGRQSETDKELAKLEVAFKIKSGVWGVLGGMLPALAALFYMLLS